MPRDYKHRRKPGRTQSAGAGSLLTGLAIGLAVALLVHLYHKGQERPDDKAPPVRRSTVTDPAVVEDADPKFDFYDLLPEFEVVIPGEIPRQPAAGRPSAAVPGQAYYIQAGSFSRFEDADRRKAALALLGVVSAIRKAEVNGRTTHRILIGPVSDPAELSRLQRQLSSNGIEYLTLKSKEPSG